MFEGVNSELSICHLQIAIKNVLNDLPQYKFTDVPWHSELDCINVTSTVCIERIKL